MSTVVEIELTYGRRGTVVTIDGVSIPKVRSVRVEHTVDDIPRVFVEVHPNVVRIKGVAEVEIVDYSEREPSSDDPGVND